MFWVAWKGYNNGKAVSLGTVEQAEAEAYGMHGYPTETQAEAKPNSVNAVERPQVNAWIVAANDITGNPVKDAGHAAKAATSSILSNFSISGISGTNLVIRGGKMIIGAILIFIGVAHLSGLAEKVPGIAGKALKAAPLL